MLDYDKVDVVSRERYDELLHKEALLGNIEKLYYRMSDYAFRDAVGFLLKSAPVTETVKSDE
jgi:hypothetical protein